MSDQRCSCLEVFGENPACPLHGIGTDWWAQSIVDDPLARTELVEMLREYDRRVTELLEANNREGERRREAALDAERFETMLRAAVRLCVILGAPCPEGDEERATELERLIRQKAWEFLEETAKTCPDIVADSRGAGHA